MEVIIVHFTGHIQIRQAVCLLSCDFAFLVFCLLPLRSRALTPESRRFRVFHGTCICACSGTLALNIHLV